MNELNVDSVITQIARTLFRQPELELTDDLTAKDVQGWDSLNHVNFIIQIEEELGIRFRNDEIAQLVNVGELIRLSNLKVENSNS
ncbi:MAG TPA: acyl carrier protein [Phycisphaerales bacterium]|nr:acyl carrier protein [Phycisphaerales bacterium]HIB00490.1 acyl carrier protein [Phycisphaerales bacterium]HIB50800.1 acyl carrier protein [Phycisphaerales bacterium]HIO20220.1 acyl carrier protein [Phycisphaerales bacterium]